MLSSARQQGPPLGGNALPAARPLHRDRPRPQVAEHHRDDGALMALANPELAPLGTMPDRQRAQPRPASDLSVAAGGGGKLRLLRALLDVELGSRGGTGDRISDGSQMPAPLGVAGLDDRGSMAAPGRVHLLLRCDRQPPLGTLGRDQQQALSGVRGYKRTASGFQCIPFGLPVFEGPLARPFQGSRQRSRSQSLERSRSAQ